MNLRALALLLVAHFVAVIAPAQPPRGGSQAAGGATSNPPVGTLSVRLEDWGQMRTAAFPILGWRVGVATGNFRQLTFSEAAARADALGVANIEGSSTQKLSSEIPKNLDPNLAPGELTAVRDRLRALNLRMPAYFIPAIGPDEGTARKLFEFAKALGVETIVTSPAPESLATLDKLAEEFGVSVALYNRTRRDTPAYWDPQGALRVLEGRSKRLGVCADTGYWIEEGIKPLDGLALLKDRLVAVNLRDRSASGTKGRDVALGSGVAGLLEFLREIYRLGLKPSVITVDATGAADTAADLQRSFQGFEKALQPLLAERVGQMARAAAIRGPDRVTPEEKQKIEAALPRQALAKPKKPRKLLVMDLQVAYGGHRSIPAENLALDLMGRTTGAYEAVFNNDLDNLKYEKIKQFDAVFLNNTVGMIFVDPEVRDGLSRFIREGGGLAGNHGVSHASMDWAEFGEMIGAWRGVHREATEQAVIKIDDPASPLTAMFKGQELVYQDEFFRFPVGPYSRDKQHILLSMDVQKTDMNQGRPCAQPCTRADNDYAISWVRAYGKGRVFFCTLGHNTTLFMTPALAEHFLAGVQFILGDLEADTTPSAKLAARKQ